MKMTTNKDEPTWCKPFMYPVITKIYIFDIFELQNQIKFFIGYLDSQKLKIPKYSIKTIFITCEYFAGQAKLVSHNSELQ